MIYSLCFWRRWDNKIITMAFYIEKAIFVNRAPFERLELDFKINGINVLSAINGKGKTTIISHIVDAFYELARPFYPNEFEGKTTKYYRYSSPQYNTKRNKPSFVYLKFKNGEEIWDYIDLRDKCDENQYKSLYGNNEIKIAYRDIKSILESNNNVKYWSKNRNKKQIENIFAQNLLSYFPSYRYEIPGYLNDPYRINLTFKKDLGLNGYLPNPIEVVSGLEQLSNWLMDIVLDYYIYKTNDSLKLRQNFNLILSKTLSSKIIGDCRIGIGQRNNAATRIAVVQDITEDEIVDIYPSIFNISSGEAAILCLFGELLHQADKIGKLLDVSGIVLIDEVDKHLHIKLQKEILPKLFNLFPNIQFIISSHSPFLNMGLADEALEKTQIIDLDNSGVICEPTNNDLYKEVYNMMLNENQRFADKYKELEIKIAAINKPIIITEGKTDWKHFKAALAHFKDNHEYEDIDVEILEYSFDFGDSKLHNLLNQYKTFPHRYKIIGIFDCDEANGKNIHHSGGIKKYGENIIGMSIPVPKFREYNTGGISIEFLYNDEDLKLQDNNGRRIYITSEFNENGRLIEDVKIGVKNNHDVKNYIQSEKEKIQADEVIDINGNSLALSKEAFATNILNREGNFANVNFDAFKPVFDRLKEILGRN